MEIDASPTDANVHTQLGMVSHLIEGDREKRATRHGRMTSAKQHIPAGQYKL